MNSLNESASLEVEPPSGQEVPLSPVETDSKETIGAISRAYQDIFVSTQDRLNKRVKLDPDSPSYFQNNPQPQDANHHGHANMPTFHSTASVGYAVPAARCPVASSDKNCPVSSMDNSRYSYPALSSQNHCTSSVDPHKHASPANPHHYNHSTAQSQGQGNTCPWKLPAGSKVLVSKSKSISLLYVAFKLILFHIYTYIHTYHLSLLIVSLGLSSERMPSVRSRHV